MTDEKDPAPALPPEVRPDDLICRDGRSEVVRLTRSYAQDAVYLECIGVPMLDRIAARELAALLVRWADESDEAAKEQPPTPTELALAQAAEERARQLSRWGRHTLPLACGAPSMYGVTTSANALRAQYEHRAVLLGQSCADIVMEEVCEFLEAADAFERSHELRSGKYTESLALLDKAEREAVQCAAVFVQVVERCAARRVEVQQAAASAQVVSHE